MNLCVEPKAANLNLSTLIPKIYDLNQERDENREAFYNDHLALEFRLAFPIVVATEKTFVEVLSMFEDTLPIKVRETIFY